MNNYSKTAALAVILVMILAVTAFGNGATPGAGAGPTVKPTAPVVVQPAPTPPVGAGVGTGTPAVTPPTTAMRCYTVEQLLPLTVSEAWELSGRNYDIYRDIVRVMTNYSLQKRGLVIPDTREAGMEIGRLIRQKAEADPNQLLYAVVDSSVREYATIHGLIAQPVR